MNSKPQAGMPPDIHELAGEYVLGTLSAARRREVQARLATDAALQVAVHAWEERLLPLAWMVTPNAFELGRLTGRAALHTGLDFAADPGTQIQAAAGGVVQSTDYHPQYGNLLEIDHGNGLVTRYAHTSKILVRTGDLVKRGQVVALVGTTGRSTGPHLHFEVLVEGVPQDPARFLAVAPPPTLASQTTTPPR